MAIRGYSTAMCTLQRQIEYFVSTDGFVNVLDVVASVADCVDIDKIHIGDFKHNTSILIGSLNKIIKQEAKLNAKVER